MTKTITVVGGDERTLRMVKILCSMGYEVQTMGLYPKDQETCDLAKATIVLLPYPYAVKDECIQTQTDLILEAKEVLAKLPEHAVVIAGMGLEGDDLQEIIKQKALTVFLYASAKSFLQANTDISAEAAVYEAMQRFEETVDGMEMLVMGYGLFGRALAKRLQALGAKVTVCVRRESVLNQVTKEGMRGLLIEELEGHAPKVQMVLNTIPARVLSEDFLQLLPKKAVILELASAPYGFDRQVADRYGIASYILPALPAKYAPQSAATALTRASLQWIKEGL